MWNNKVGRYGNKHHKSRQVLSISWLYQNPHTTSHFEGLPNGSSPLILKAFLTYWTFHKTTVCEATVFDYGICSFTWSGNCPASGHQHHHILAIFRTIISIKYSCYCNLNDTNLDTFGAPDIRHIICHSAVDRLWADWIMPERTRTTL